MKWIVERARYLSYIPIIGMLVGVLSAIYVGAEKTIKVVQIAVLHHESNSPTLYVLFEALDSFLVAVALLVISVSLYELFISGLKVPDWMLVRNLDELKAKFGSVLIPIMAVKFVQKAAPIGKLARNAVLWHCNSSRFVCPDSVQFCCRPA